LAWVAAPKPACDGEKRPGNVLAGTESVTQQKFALGIFRTCPGVQNIRKLRDGKTLVYQFIHEKIFSEGYAAC